MTTGKRMIIGISAIFLLGSFFHFCYEFLGKSPLAAPFFPVNESVWEHLKLLSIGALVWMAADYFFADKTLRPRFFSARAAALPLGLLLMPMIYYFLKDAFGIDNMWVDIGNFLVVSATYQMLALHFEKNPKVSRYNILGIAAIAVVLLVFSVFTFLPPHLPLFQDAPTGGYGILD